MKKSLFLLASIGAFALVNAQTVFVKANTDVKVKPGALFYVDGNVKVDKYTEDGKKFSNEGMVKITTNLETSTDADAKTSFVDEHTSVGKYGQLIVKNGTANVGKIASNVKIKDGYVLLPLAIPYNNVTAESIVKDFFDVDNVDAGFVGYSGSGFDANRLKNTLFAWNNDDYRFDQLAKDKSPKPGVYYALNAKYSGLNKLDLVNVKKIHGTPNNNDVTITLKKYSLKENKNTDTNKYGEAYGSYITDFTVAMPSGWDNYHIRRANGKKNNSDFGSRIYDLANPFTSNINISNLSGSFLSNVKAIVQYDSQDYTDDINKGNASGSKGKDSYTNVSMLTSNLTGDEQVAVVPPFQTFSVKMKESMGDTETVMFNDAVKTFDSPASGNLVNTMFARGGERTAVNQVGLDLYNANGFTGAKTYVVASKIYKAAAKGEGVELYNVAMTDKNTGIYTLQEDEDGFVDKALENNRAYINGVNDKYVGKPIHLVFQNGNGQYTIKARLNSDLAKNKNSFYFEDKKEGKVLKVGKDFSYTFNVQGTDKDRFVLYWAKTPKAELSKDLAKEVKSSSIVYKDADGSYKVRFDNTIKKADVFVYNISGQLVSVAKAVDTSSDYVVPVKGNSSIYVVKVVGDNGTVTTKKIIK